jgi:crotonobetainyl-CoA:carnitine CoA-transferase CaiB-like acyl-CoA transferase
VVDLSALWAGPLCGHLLGLNGASVIKAEDPRRPDGARATPDFFAALNGAKQEQAIDISADLPALLADADVVITSARPRAFEQLGIDVNAVLRDQNVVWIAITAHGWDGPGRNRVGFGDDAAVAAGLVVDLGDGRPGFVGDAVADPLCGVLAAAAATIYLGEGGSWFVDISLSGAAAYAVTS